MTDLQIAPLPASRLAEATQLLHDSCAYDKAHLVAQEKLFGDAALQRKAQPLAAYSAGGLVGVACSSERWLRLLAVAPEHRRKGVGSALLQAAETQIAEHSARAQTMDQPGNYLSPGIDQRNQQTIQWLGKRGYNKARSECNVLISLQDNLALSKERFQQRQQALHTAGYQISRLAAQDIEAVADQIESDFSAGWAFEVRKAALPSQSGVHVARTRDTGTLVGFAAHDGNNQGMGSFGPTGTLPPHRGKGLGAALLLACLHDIQGAGHSRAEVAWIGPRQFYDKIAGIESERFFTVMCKDLHD